MSSHLAFGIAAGLALGCWVNELLVEPVELGVRLLLHLILEVYHITLLLAQRLERVARSPEVLLRVELLHLLQFVLLRFVGVR